MEKINKQDFKLPLMGFAGVGLICLLNWLCVKLGYDGMIGNAVIDFGWLFCLVMLPLYAMNLGKYRAHYVVLKGGKEDKWNEHINNAFAHILFSVMVCYIVRNPFQPFFMLCMFSFFHDGAQYKEINKIVPGTYPKGWWDFTKTPKSFMDKLYGNTGSRVLLFAFGLICYLGFQYYYAR